MKSRSLLTAEEQESQEEEGRIWKGISTKSPQWKHSFSQLHFWTHSSLCVFLSAHARMHECKPVSVCVFIQYSSCYLRFLSPPKNEKVILAELHPLGLKGSFYNLAWQLRIRRYVNYIYWMWHWCYFPVAMQLWALVSCDSQWNLMTVIMNMFLGVRKCLEMYMLYLW